MKFPEAALLLIFIISIFSFIFADTQLNKNVERKPKIINGSPISITNAPYEVSLHMKYIDSDKGLGAGAFCSGAVISQRMVLTAASCIINFGSDKPVALPVDIFYILMGTNSTNQTDQNTLQYNVQKFVVNPNFNLTLQSYDIAAAFINGYIPWNWPTVKAIQLNTKAMPVGVECLVSGWQMGMYTYNPTALMSIPVNIISNMECSPITPNSTVPQSILCAVHSNTSSGLDTCTGDIGNPLVCNGLLTGIALRGKGCDILIYPGYYVNVSDVYDWIIQTNASFDYNSYNGAVSDIYIHSYVMIFLSVFVALALQM